MELIFRCEIDALFQGNSQLSPILMKRKTIETRFQHQQDSKEKPFLERLPSFSK